MLGSPITRSVCIRANLVQTHGGVEAPISIPVLASSQAGRSMAINLYAGRR